MPGRALPALRHHGITGLGMDGHRAASRRSLSDPAYSRFASVHLCFAGAYSVGIDGRSRRR